MLCTWQIWQIGNWWLLYFNLIKEEKLIILSFQNPGRLKFTNSNIIFKNSKTGKIEQIGASDVALVNWQKLASGYGLRVFLENGQLHRFGGFREHVCKLFIFILFPSFSAFVLLFFLINEISWQDQEKLVRFFSVNYEKEMQEKELCVKGWNWGSAVFKGMWHKC